MAKRPGASIKKAKELQAKLKSPVRSPKKAVAKINKELRSVRNPIYSLNRKIKNAPSRYYKSKYKKELKAYQASASEKISSLVQERNNINSLKREFDSLKREKRNLLRELKDIEKRMSAAKRKGNMKELGDLSLKHAGKRMSIKDIEIATGLKKERPGPDEDFEPRIRGDFQADPNNPYTFWQGVRKFDEDVSSMKWKYIIIAGKRFSGEHPIEVSAEGKVYFAQFDADSKTHVFRYINYNSLTVKYVVQDGNAITD